MPFRHLRFIVAFVIACCLSSMAMAQGVGKAPGIAADQRSVIEGLSQRTDALEKTLNDSLQDDGKLVEVRLQLEEIGRSLLNSGVAFRPRLTEIKDRIDQLGAPPAEGQPPEPDIITAERGSLVAERAEINAVLGLAENVALRVSNLIDRISTLRSDLFRNLLTKRYKLTDAFGLAVVQDASTEFQSFYRSVSSWLSFVINYKFQAVLGATLFAFAVAVVLLIGGRRLFKNYFEAESIETPTYLRRLSVAFWATLLPTVAMAVFLGATYFFYDYFNVLRGDIGIFLRALFIVVGTVFCVNRLANATLSPRQPKWRLIPVESKPARWLVRLATAMAVTMAVNNFFAVVNEQMGSPLSLTVARSFVATVLVGILLIWMARIKPFRTAEGEWRRWPGWLRFTAYGLGGFTIAMALLGYIGLAIFMALQVVVTSTILITAYIGFLAARAIGAEGGFAETSLGRWYAVRHPDRSERLDQFGIALSLVINLILLVLFLPITLFMWGFQPGDIQTWAYKLATGFTIGSFSFSPMGILTGILVFAIGYFLTRWFQSWLDGSVMARGKLDTGVRNSIRTVIGYAGLALAALIAISSAGINLSNLALIAGGLSLGIGFGLQNVVSNFVSGLILLAERPFKAGDWIVAGAVSGTVKKISVRATEIETFQRQTVILPNSELINSAVGNWTHRNKLGRIDIKVSVAYGTDVKRTHAILAEIAKSHPLALKNPEPFVLFANFGAAALEFEIRLFTADVLNGNILQNDIRFAIVDAFDREGIEIPSTPRAVEPKLEKWPIDDERAEAEYAHGTVIAEAAKSAALMKRRSKVRKPDPD